MPSGLRLLRSYSTEIPAINLTATSDLSPASLARYERRAKNVIEIVRPIAILVRQELIGDLAQTLGQRKGHGVNVGARVFAHYGAHRVDVLVDKRERNAVEVSGVLD